MTWIPEDGLRFGCQQCGKCCKGPEPGYVWTSPSEVEALAKRLSMTVEEFGLRYLRRIGERFSIIEKANHDCIFWENGCTVYEDRPQQCRTFPFWPELIASREAWSSVSWCQGKDQGRLYSPEEIQRVSRGEGEASSRSS